MSRFISCLMIILTSATLFFSCAMVEDLLAPKFDTSSIESFQTSYEKVTAKLTEEEKNKLNEAILYQSAMYIKDHPGSFIAAGIAAAIDDGKKSDNPILNSVGRDAMKIFDGKSARQIIHEYEEARK